MNNQVMEKPKLDVFDQLESEVRSYCRSFKTVFHKARNAKLWDTRGNEYIDFLPGRARSIMAITMRKSARSWSIICWRTA